MSLLKYFKHKDGLPDPRGSLSATLPQRAISRANCEVQEELAEIVKEKAKKRGPYRR